MMNTRRTPRLAHVARSTIAAIAALAVVAGCGLGGSDTDGSGGDDDATLRIGMASEAQSLDPPNFLLAGDLTRMDHLYEGLVSLNADGSISPSLATDWEQLSDTEWEFTLREGVTFHDGEVFDAAAVETSLERARTQSQGQGFLAVIEDVEVIDDSTVVLVLERPFSSILNNLTIPAAAIISPLALEESGDDIATAPVGTGPYQFVSWTPDTSMVFERFDEYWGEPAALAEVEFLPIPEASTRFAALQAGDVDVIENPPPTEVATLEASEDLYAIIEPRGRPIFLGFNLETVPNVNVRRAVAYAIDQEAIVESVLEGVGRPATEGLIPPEFIEGAEPVGYPYDPEAARAELEGVDPAELEIEFAVPTERYLRDQEIAEVIVDQLSEVGITVSLNAQEPGTWYQSLLDRETEMYWLGWGLTTGDPADVFERVFRTDAVNNMSQFSDPASDALIEELATTPVGTPERLQILEDLQRTVVEDEVAVVPIYQSSNFYAARVGVQGFGTTITEMIDLSEVTVD